MNITSHTFGEPLSLVMKALNFMLPTISVFLTAIGLAIDWHYIALAAGSTMAGSLIFGYFRREKTFGAQLYKFMVATIGGLVLGSFIAYWRDYTAPAVISLTYCVSAMLVLIFLRTVVSLFEENSRTFTVTLIERIFNIKLDPRKPTRQRSQNTDSRPRQGIHLTEDNGGHQSVTIDNTATPDEVRIIEQTVIQKPKSEPPA